MGPGVARGSEFIARISDILKTLWFIQGVFYYVRRHVEPGQRIDQAVLFIREDTVQIFAGIREGYAVV